MSEVTEQSVVKTRKGFKKSKIGELNGPRTRANESKWEEISVELILDCLLEIFKYLSVLNRIRIARVNKTWYEASRLSLSSLKSWKIGYGYSKIVFEELKTNSRIKVNCASHNVFEKLLHRFGEFVSELHVSNAKNDYQVMIILSSCRNLEKVQMSHMCIDKVRFLLCKLEKLNDLSLKYMKGIDKDGCLELVLSRLRLTSFYIHNENLKIREEFFKNLPSDIKSLGLEDCEFTSEESAFNMLGNFKHLRSLSLIYMLYEADVKLFINLMKKLNLKKLNISWNFEVVDDDFLIELAKHSNGLTELNISGNSMTDKGLNAVTNLSNLETLDIGNSYQIEGNVDVNLPNLKYLRCQESPNISEKTLIKFLKSSDKIEILKPEKISKDFIIAAGKVAQARKSQIPMKIVIAPNDKDIVNNCSEEDTRQLKIVTYNDEL